MTIPKLFVLILAGFMFCLPGYNWAETPAWPNTAASHGVAGSARNITSELVHDGLTRHYLLHVPPSLQPGETLPLVMVFHGGFGSGDIIARHIGLNRIADKNRFMVVYPDGIDKHWNDGRSTTASGADDVSFIAALIDHLMENYPVDQHRIYATGMSNGGYLTQRLACELSDRIAAFAPVSSTMPVPLRASCRPRQPVSIMMINGIDDPLVPWNGGELVRGQRMGGRGGQVISVPETIDFWRRHDGCTGSQEVNTLPGRDPDDGTTVVRTTYGNCKDDSVVVLVAIEGGGHTWPGAPERSKLKSRVGNTSYDIDASQMIWEFFREHRM